MFLVLKIVVVMLSISVNFVASASIIAPKNLLYKRDVAQIDAGAKNEGKLAQIADDAKKSSALQDQIQAASLTRKKLKNDILKYAEGKQQGQYEVVSDVTGVGQQLSDAQTSLRLLGLAASSPATQAPVATLPAATAPVAPPVMQPVAPQIVQPVALPAVPTGPPVTPVVSLEAKQANSTGHVFKPLSTEHKPELQANNLNTVGTTLEKQRIPRPRPRQSVDEKNDLPLEKFQPQCESDQGHKSRVQQYDYQVGIDVQDNYAQDGCYYESDQQDGFDTNKNSKRYFRDQGMSRRYGW